MNFLYFQSNLFMYKLKPSIKIGGWNTSTKFLPHPGSSGRDYPELPVKEIKSVQKDLQTDPVLYPAYLSFCPSPHSSSCRRTQWRWWRARTGSRRACGAAGRPESSAGSQESAGCTCPASTPSRDPGGPLWSPPPSSVLPHQCLPDELWTYRKSVTSLMRIWPVWTVYKPIETTYFCTREN